MKGFSFLTGQYKFDGIYYVLFFPPQKEERIPPTLQHICSPTSRRSKPKLAKELQFCLHTPAKLLHLSF